jgi:uncharacterized membrane protein
VLGIAGLAALAFGTWQLRSAARSWQDWVLVIIGAALVWLAIAQIRTLCGSRTSGND